MLSEENMGLVQKLSRICSTRASTKRDQRFFQPNTGEQHTSYIVMIINKIIKSINCKLINFYWNKIDLEKENTIHIKIKTGTISTGT